MKSNIIRFMFPLLFPLALGAQNVSGIAMNEIQAEYLEISPVPKADNKYVVHVDFGQVDETFNLKDTQIKDSAGLPMRFNSVMDGLNFMTGFGYELVDTYITTSESSSSPHFIMRKKQAVPMGK